MTSNDTPFWLRMLIKQRSMKSPALNAGTITLSVGLPVPSCLGDTTVDVLVEVSSDSRFRRNSLNPSTPPCRRCHSALRHCCPLTWPHHRSSSPADGCFRRSTHSRHADSGTVEVPTYGLDRFGPRGFLSPLTTLPTI